MAESQPLAGRVALITGANTGIGLVTARELARQGARVFIACRSSEKMALAVESIAHSTGVRVETLPLDLGDFGSIRACGAAFSALGLPLHLLINNAGLAGGRGITASGFELSFGTNHLGHFLLTHLLLPRIREADSARIVTVASQAHYGARGVDFEAIKAPTRSLTGFPEYQVAKLANVLFSAELARKLEGSGVRAYALHPGVVASDVWRSVPWPFRGVIKLGMLSTEEGARTTLYCATSPEVARDTGRYYDASRMKEPSALAQDVGLARTLWEKSARFVGLE